MLPWRLISALDRVTGVRAVDGVLGEVDPSNDGHIWAFGVSGRCSCRRCEGGGKDRDGELDCGMKLATHSSTAYSLTSALLKTATALDCSSQGNGGLVMVEELRRRLLGTAEANGA